MSGDGLYPCVDCGKSTAGVCWRHSGYTINVPMPALDFDPIEAVKDLDRMKKQRAESEASLRECLAKMDRWTLEDIIRFALEERSRRYKTLVAGYEGGVGKGRIE